MKVFNGCWVFKRRLPLAVKFLGLVLFIFSGFFFYSAFFSSEVGGLASGGNFLLLSCCFACVFMLMGVSLMGGYKLIRVSINEQLFISQAGIVLPLPFRTSYTTEFEFVELKEEVRVTKSREGVSSRRYVYTVRINGQTNRQICEVSRVIEARKVAESLALYLNVPVKDSSRGHEVVRAAAELDMSVAERALNGDYEVKDIQLKGSMGIDSFVNEHGQQIRRLWLGRLADREEDKGKRNVLFLVFGIVCVLGFFLFPEIDDASGRVRVAGLVFDSILFLVFCILPLSILSKPLLLAYRQTELLFCEDVLHVNMSVLGFKHNHSLPFNEIEELEVGVVPRRIKICCLNILSDKKHLMIGHGYAREDLQAVCDYLLQEMVLEYKKRVV